MGDNIWNDLLEKYAPTAFEIFKEGEAVISVQHSYCADYYTNKSLLHKETYDLLFTYWNKNIYGYTKVLTRGKDKVEALRELEKKVKIAKTKSIASI